MNRADWRGWLLGVFTLGLLIAAVVVPAMPQPLSYHVFADCRTFWAIPNFLNVASNLPFLVAGSWGLALIWNGRGAFIDIPVASNTVVDFAPLPDGRLAFGAQDPTWGVISAQGEVVRRHLLDHRSARRVANELGLNTTRQVYTVLDRALRRLRRWIHAREVPE